MDKYKQQYIQHFKDKSFLLSSLFGIVFLAASFVVNYYAALYANSRESNSVTDLILSNIRTFNVDGIFVYGAIIFLIFVTLLCIIEPKRIPFITKSIASFILIRSIFISLTHIAVFPVHIPIANSGIFSMFSMEGDLFFSGHTGLPFLMALIFWDNKYLRYLFLAASGLFGVVVLLGHLHYSIDVLSAFFITYAIYRIAEYLFKKDEILFKSSIRS